MIQYPGTSKVAVKDMGMTPIGSTNIGQTMTAMGLNPNTIAQQADLQNIQQLQQMLAMLEASQYQMGSQGMGQYGTMPPTAMSPYGMPPPSTAFNNSQSYLGQSYYGGPSPYGQMSPGPQIPSFTNNQMQGLQLMQQLMQQLQSMQGMNPYGAMGANPMTWQNGYGSYPPGMAGGGMGNYPVGMPGGGMGSGMMNPYGGIGGTGSTSFLPGPGGGMGGVAGLNMSGAPPITSLPPIPGETQSSYLGRIQAAQNEQLQEQLGNFTSAVQMASQLYSAIHSLNQSIIQNIR